MKKWILGMSCLLSMGGWCETSDKQQEIKAIEQEIQALKERWHQINLKEMDEEVKGQGLMIADWEKYAQEVELIRRQEQEDNQIEKRIQQLEARKAQLLKQQEQTH